MRNKTIKSLSSLFKMKGDMNKNLVCNVFLSLIYTILTLAVPYVVGLCVDAMDFVNTDMSKVFCYVLVILGFALLSSVCYLLISKLSNNFTYKLTNDLRKKCYAKYNKTSMKDISEQKSGFFKSVIINDCESISDGLILFFNSFFSDIFTIVITIVIIAIINVKAALIVLFLTPLSLLIAKFITSRIHKYYKKQNELKAVQTGFITEMIDNHTDSVLNSYNGKAVTDFEALSDNYVETTCKATFFSSIVNPSARLFNNSIYAVILLFCAFLCLRNEITVGMFSSLLAYSTVFMKPFNEITNILAELNETKACIDRVNAYLEGPEMSSDSKSEVSVDGDIVFENVYFSYKDKPVIKGVNLVIPAGKKVALVGPTGCGKTTLVNLLMRFYDADEGTIKISGVPIEECSVKSLRSNIGMVTQEPWLKSESIIDNLKYASEDKSDDEIMNISRKLGSDSYIERFPNSYNTVLRKGDNTVSEGQKQLLTIVRAFASDPQILILDEATSGIDVATEKKVQNAVNLLCEGRTSLIIAHKLSTIVNSDLIVVMKEGKILEQGTHDELLSMNGFYSDLYSSYTDCDII